MFSASLAAMLSQYPDAVIIAVTDPLTGLPAHRDRAPTVNQLREACEAANTSNQFGRRRSDLELKTLEERRAFEQRTPGAREERLRYERGEISEYLRNGGALPGPGQAMGRFDRPLPPAMASSRSVLPDHEKGGRG